jgi:hypothetical protein
MTTVRQDDEMPPRDSRVAAAWRAASSEEPPSALDAAILAAARREIGAGSRPTTRPEAWRVASRWWPLAAAATVGAIAAGLLQLVPPEELRAPATDNAVVTDIPAPAAKPAPGMAGPMLSGEARTDVPTAALGHERTARSAEAPRRAPPSAPRPAPTEVRPPAGDVAPLPQPFPADAPKREAPFPADAPKRERAVPATTSIATAPLPPAPSAPDLAARGASRNEAPPPPALAKMAAAPATREATADARAKDRGPLPIPEWIALIRTLRADGRIDDATRELAAFRAAHADHEQLLPADLRDWRPPEK